jgi:hypothetical protein
MSSQPDTVRSRKNAGNGSTYVHSETQVSPYRQSSEDASCKRGDYVLLHRPDRLFTFFKSWRHWWKGDVEASDHMKPKKERMRMTWRTVLSLGFLNVLWLLSGVLAFIGKCVELPGNVWNANGGLWQGTKRLLGGGFVVPGKNDLRYHSLISQLDPRTKLWVDKSAAGQAHSESATSTIFPGNDAGARSTGDVLVMASKLAYENEAVINDVVTNDWKVSTTNLRTIINSNFFEN